MCILQVLRTKIHVKNAPKLSQCFLSENTLGHMACIFVCCLKQYVQCKNTEVFVTCCVKCAFYVHNLIMEVNQKCKNAPITCIFCLMPNLLTF